MAKASRKGRLKWRNKRANRGRKGSKSLPNPAFCKSNK